MRDHPQARHWARIGELDQAVKRIAARSIHLPLTLAPRRQSIIRQLAIATEAQRATATALLRQPLIEIDPTYDAARLLRLRLRGLAQQLAAAPSTRRRIIAAYAVSRAIPTAPPTTSLAAALETGPGLGAAPPVQQIRPGDRAAGTRRCGQRGAQTANATARAADAWIRRRQRATLPAVDDHIRLRPHAMLVDNVSVAGYYDALHGGRGQTAGIGFCSSASCGNACTRPQQRAAARSSRALPMEQA